MPAVTSSAARCLPSAPLVREEIRVRTTTIPASTGGITTTAFTEEMRCSPRSYRLTGELDP